MVKNPGCPPGNLSSVSGCPDMFSGCPGRPDTRFVGPWRTLLISISYDVFQILVIIYYLFILNVLPRSLSMWLTYCISADISDKHPGVWVVSDEGERLNQATLTTSPHLPHSVTVTLNGQSLSKRCFFFFLFI